RAKKAQDEAMLTAADKDLTRSKTLVASNITSQQIVDQQQGKVDQLKASIAADEAGIQTAQTNLDYTSITAPTDGRIGVRLVARHTSVHPCARAGWATLPRPHRPAVMSPLPARYLDEVRAAQARGRVGVPAFAQDNRRALATGTLLLVDNLIDHTTATIRLKA